MRGAASSARQPGAGPAAREEERGTHDGTEHERVDLVAQLDAKDLEGVHAGCARPPLADDGGGEGPRPGRERVSARRAVQAGQDEQRQQALDAEHEREVRDELARAVHALGVPPRVVHEQEVEEERGRVERDDGRRDEAVLPVQEAESRALRSALALGFRPRRDG